MKEIIHDVLKKYTGREANLDSLALREMITDEITYELERKGIRMLSSHYSNGKEDYVDDDLSL